VRALNARTVNFLSIEETIVFDLYPRHSHRTPQQIAEDTGGTFEPSRPRRADDQFDATNGAAHGDAGHDSAADGARKPGAIEPR
jgi:hypothetical protein